jgi:UDP-2,3-diacylglucosamine pyrophosphatase LpxH
VTRHEGLARRRLDRLYRGGTREVSLAEGPLAVVSDLHMGNGGWADNFRGNHPAAVAALRKYRREGRRTVLLGDIEELWQFAPGEITEARSDVYSEMRAAGREGLLRVWGNHDEYWAGAGVRDPAGAPPAAEALRVGTGGRAILMVHGHQGTLDSDVMSGISRLLVRAFRWVEGPWILLMKALGLYRRPSTMARIPRDFEQVMYRWARDRDVVLVCGHTHRAVFASRSHAERLRAHIGHLRGLLGQVPPQAPEAGELRLELRRTVRELRVERRQRRDIPPVGEGPLPLYYNCGCGLYRQGITALEVGPAELRLVKWGAAPPVREVYHRARLEDIL